MEARRTGSRRRKGWAAAGPHRPGRSDWRTAGGARCVNLVQVQNVGGRPVHAGLGNRCPPVGSRGEAPVGVWGTKSPRS